MVNLYGPMQGVSFLLCLAVIGMALPSVHRHIGGRSLLVYGESLMSMYVGESLVGDGNEIAHIDLLIGSKDGPVGTAFANAIASRN